MRTGITSHIESPGMPERLLGIQKELERQQTVFDHEGGDIRLARFCEASLALIADYPMKPVVEDYLAVNPTDTPSYAVNKLLRAPQKQLLFNNPHSGYPYRDYDKVDGWMRELPRIYVGRHPYDIGALYLDLLTRPAAANVSDRYQGPDIIIGMAEARFDEPPATWDVGCSINQGLRRMKRQKEIPFNAFTVVQPEIPGDNHPELVIPDTEATNRLKQHIGKVAIGESYGIDLYDYYRRRSMDDGGQGHLDDQPFKWARSCSFYPSELLDEQRRINFRRLEEDVPGVLFAHADFSDDVEKLEKILPQENPKVIIFSTVLYQKPELLPKMVENAKHFIDEDGLIIVQDFMEVDEQDPNKLHVIGSWFSLPFSYRTFVYDMKRPEEGFMEVFKWKNGRCEKMILGKDYAKFAGEN